MYKKYLYSSGTRLELLIEQAKGERRGAVVFAHGICHGAWCWENFLHFFSERGYDCYALSYHGHGGSSGRMRLDSFSIADYVEDIHAAVGFCAGASGCKPVLVGHSMGGGAVQKYIGSYAKSVCGAVLFASATAGGLPKSIVCDMLIKPELRTTFKVVLGLPTSDDALSISAFFGGRLSAGEAGKYRPLLQRESLRVMSADMLRPFTRNYNVGIPVLVLGSDADAFFPTASQKMTAERYGTEPVMLNGLCHDMMLDPEWELSAKAVLDFISQIK